MANMIKNALIKQLSKYLKNVSANQINISTFKGEGEMKNIELDENIIMSLIELPTWLKITKATCNRATFKIAWTKLKTQPICIHLEKISLTMETAEDLREFKTREDNMFKELGAGSYGFIDKCIDGMYLTIDSVSISLISKTFNAKLDLSNIYVYSTTPNWQTCQDIRMTRIKDVDKGEVIMFKEISWETSRIEAYSIDVNTNEVIGSPIKLIMNQSKAQITIKKRLSDKSPLASTLKLLLNDIYWMANDTQLKAAIVAYSAIQKLMTKAFKQKSKYALYKIQQEEAKAKLAAEVKQHTIPNAQKPSDLNASKVFRQFDILETSLHLHASTLNLHLFCDENISGNKLLEGGTMQIVFKKLCLDHYPYHKVGTTISHWLNYNHVFTQKQEFSKKLLVSFTEELMDLLKKVPIDASNASKISHINLIEACTVITVKDFSIYSVTSNLTNMRTAKSRMRGASTQSESTEATRASTKFTSNLYLNTNGEKFLESNFGEFNLPSDTVLINVFLSEFYFPDEFNYPLPNIQIFSQISPIKLNVDYLTLLWANMLYLALSTEIIPLVNELNAKSSTANSSTSPHHQLFDASVECILPKLSLKLYNSSSYSSDIPKFLNILCSSLKLTNLCVDQENDLNNLCKKIYNDKNLCMNFDRWPFEPTDLLMVPKCLLEIYKEMQANSLKNEKISEKIVSPKHGLLITNLSKKEFKTNRISSAYLFLINVENLWVEMSSSQPKTSVNGQDSTNNENTIVLPVSLKLWLVNTGGYYDDQMPILPESNDKRLKLRFGDCFFSESGRSFYVDNPNGTIKPRNYHKRSKSNSDNPNASSLRQRNDVKTEKHFNAKFNLICDIVKAQAKISHFQLLFLLRLLDELSYFQHDVEQDAAKVLSNLSKENKMQNLKSSISVSAAIFIDKIELKLLINDKRTFKSKPKSISFGSSKSELAATSSVASIDEHKKFTKSYESNANISKPVCQHPLVDNSPTKITYDEILDEFIVIPEFKKQPKIMSKADKDINYLILKEHIQQIYGVLDNSKYIHNMSHHHQSSTANVAANKQTVVAQNQKPLQRADATIKPKIQELSVASLKASLKDSKTTIFSFSRLSNAETDSMIDYSDDSDSGSISLSVIGSTVDLSIHEQRNVNEVVLLKESSIEVSTEVLNSSEAASFHDSEKIANEVIVKENFEVVVELNDLQFCAQLLDDSVNVFGRLFHLRILDNNEFDYEKNEKTEINVRLSKGLASNRKHKDAKSNGFLELRLLNECFCLNQSTLTGLIELVEDETSENSLPVKIQIFNCKVNMSSDIRSGNQNPDKLGSPVIAFIKYLEVIKNPNGEIVVSSEKSNLSKNKEDNSLSFDVAKEEGSRAVDEKEKCYVKELEEKMKRMCEENDELKKSLATSSNKISALESERRRLLESIDKLDDQLFKADKK